MHLSPLANHPASIRAKEKKKLTEVQAPWLRWQQEGSWIATGAISNPKGQSTAQPAPELLLEACNTPHPAITFAIIHLRGSFSPTPTHNPFFALNIELLKRLSGQPVSAGTSLPGFGPLHRLCPCTLNNCCLFLSQ